MTVVCTMESNDLFVIEVDGVYTAQDEKLMQDTVGDDVIRSKKAKVLVLADNFKGWAKGGDWGDLTFMVEHDPYVEKIALVVHKNWEEKLLMFVATGDRHAQVRSFSHKELDDARAWLNADSD